MEKDRIGSLVNRAQNGDLQAMEKLLTGERVTHISLIHNTILREYGMVLVRRSSRRTVMFLTR